MSGPCQVPTCQHLCIGKRKYCQLHRNHKTPEQRAKSRLACKRKQECLENNTSEDTKSDQSSINNGDDSDSEDLRSNTKTQRKLIKMMRYIKEDNIVASIHLDFDLYLKYGERIKSLLYQTTPKEFKVHPHLWVYGPVS